MLKPRQLYLTRRLYKVTARNKNLSFNYKKGCIKLQRTSFSLQMLQGGCHAPCCALGLVGGDERRKDPLDVQEIDKPRKCWPLT